MKINFKMNQNNINLTNELEEIVWSIDKTPDYNLLNNIRINNNEDFIPFIKESIQYETHIEMINITEEEKNCCICLEKKESKDICQINCGHKFCAKCTIKYISKKNSNNCCPLCRETITHITFQDEKYKHIF